MKKALLITFFLVTLLLTPSRTLAQGMMGNWTSSPSSIISDDHTVREEAEGKEVWEKLQGKQLECKNLTNDHYAVLGEYFMGQSIGNTQRHALMNQMMTNMMGEAGEEQMHIAMGKRLSGCEPNAQVPQGATGFMPMMWVMGSSSLPQVGGGENSMMGWNYGSVMEGFGSLMFIFWIVLLIDLVLLGVWLWKQINKK